MSALFRVPAPSVSLFVTQGLKDFDWTVGLPMVFVAAGTVGILAQLGWRRICSWRNRKNQDQVGNATKVRELLDSHNAFKFYERTRAASNFMSSRTGYFAIITAGGSGHCFQPTDASFDSDRYTGPQAHMPEVLYSDAEPMVAMFGVPLENACYARGVSPSWTGGLPLPCTGGDSTHAAACRACRPARQRHSVRIHPDATLVVLWVDVLSDETYCSGIEEHVVVQHSVLKHGRISFGRHRGDHDRAWRAHGLHQATESLQRESVARRVEWDAAECKEREGVEHEDATAAAIAFLRAKAAVAVATATDATARVFAVHADAARMVGPTSYKEGQLHRPVAHRARWSSAFPPSCAPTPTLAPTPAPASAPASTPAPTPAPAPVDAPVHDDLPRDSLLRECPLWDGGWQLSEPAVEEWVAVPGGGFVRGGEGVAVPLLDARPAQAEAELKWDKRRRAFVAAGVIVREAAPTPPVVLVLWSKSKGAFVERPALRVARPAPWAGDRASA